MCRQASWRAYVSFVFFKVENNLNIVFLFPRLFQEFIQSPSSNCSSDCFITECAFTK